MLRRLQAVRRAGRRCGGQRAVRVAEALDVGDVAMVTVELIDFT